ncbi:DNA-binding response regulator, OmpR family, contains REC and winged-helix (wHTH) domain [Cyclobacterium lianum]|uniref:DNA-binding response regulator, OmpR family, contains REC and winged-helix (WHTH) domain n=1 Tax=Cyclobacterium lianum TaxID=388280 RepID=A0A1M7QAF9_9BACT|nr:response regulator transcription factor [Cyclobacterium lianum]SHN27349.1 DNA-binding response regulator, OmpR family, contains REC and winged-helix (wHTH) domain [Cyclobacterium lianum]
MKILLIEDQLELSENITEFLSSVGVFCETCDNCFDAQDKILVNSYDSVVLDIMLPDGSGLNLIDLIKKNQANSNILIISAKNSLGDKIEGLELGADDYLTKPFHLAELHARLKALYRRNQLGGSDVLTFNEIQVNPENLQASINQTLLDLTKKEFDLLLFFMTNKDRVLGRQAIVQHLWGDYTDDLANFDFVYQHIKNLRKKICRAGARDYIETVYGIGYKFNTSAEK